MKIGAISTFLKALNTIGRGGNTLLYFRGHSKQSFKLEPTVYRNRGWASREAEMIKELILRCPNDFSGGTSTFQSLVRMQHYGLPTRLLDLTSNPLVALHFACERHEHGDEDAEIIVFKFHPEELKYFDSDTVSILANLSRRSSGFTIPDEADLDQFNRHREISLLLHDIRQERPHFEPRIRRGDLDRVICVKPRLDNPRIIRQEGAFLLFGCADRKDRPAILSEEHIVDRLVINREKKKLLTEELETLGINKATLFPEIDQVASHIRAVFQTSTVSLDDFDEVPGNVIKALLSEGPLSTQLLAERLGVPPEKISGVTATLHNKSVLEPSGAGRKRGWRISEKVRIE